MNNHKDLTWGEIKAMFSETDRRFKESERKSKEESKKLKQFLDKVGEQVERTSRIVEETTRQIGGISNSNGDIAESYFINSFEKKPHFAGQDYDHFSSNLRKKSKKLNLQGEYDLVMYNCASVAIIEIKYKAKKEDIEPLLLKAQTFKQLFPEYANCALYLGLAGLHVNTAAEKEAIKQGIAVVKQVGENMVINDAHLKVF